MGTDSSSLLARLRRVVNKVKILLSFEMNRWRLASMIGVYSRRYRFSFNDRPGLRACTDDVESSENSVSSPYALRRTISYQSEDDIDKRAETFIENFRRQLRIERQVSLELKYLQGNGSTSTSP
ncbi:hypothetical protein K2173_016259 [Erythroxylum novogranatense]|uniref:DUF761 domain-containing protein n=1 Tax=Erythroxylum novogranatense TaxID=1862640 RepID=A0AAV8SFY3_9ROSI|nr:hypothetical protein K2173_016259 [Erythroxylum novogranatense]